MSEFLDTVRETIEQYRMLRPGDRVLIGVSGGPDSVTLLSTLVALRKEFHLDLHAGYVDHGLRPKATAKEIRLVKRLGQLWGVPVTILSRKVRKSGGESLEASARETRYEGLIGLAHRIGCRVIAVGHTADDQAETVLMWILRGTGMAGLAGIPPVRTVPGTLKGARHLLRIVRPLLGCSRADVEAYLKAQGIRAAQDRTNLDPRFLRNRIRHRLIPLLEREYNPQVRKHLNTLAEIFWEELGWVRGQVADRFREFVRPNSFGFQLNRRRLQKAPTFLRRGILQRAVEKLKGDRNGFTHLHWMTLDRLLENRLLKAVDLPHGFRAQVLDRDWIRLRRERPACRKAPRSGTL